VIYNRSITVVLHNSSMYILYTVLYAVLIGLKSSVRIRLSAHARTMFGHVYRADWTPVICDTMFGHVYSADWTPVICDTMFGHVYSADWTPVICDTMFGYIVDGLGSFATQCLAI
jgi:hypothetical protein